MSISDFSSPLLRNIRGSDSDASALVLAIAKKQSSRLLLDEGARVEMHTFYSSGVHAQFTAPAQLLFHYFSVIPKPLQIKIVIIKPMKRI